MSIAGASDRDGARTRLPAPGLRPSYPPAARWRRHGGLKTPLRRQCPASGDSSLAMSSTEPQITPTHTRTLPCRRIQVMRPGRPHDRIAGMLLPVLKIVRYPHAHHLDSVALHRTDEQTEHPFMVDHLARPRGSLADVHVVPLARTLTNSATPCRGPRTTGAAHEVMALDLSSSTTS